jgi:hypothetical protein
MIKKTGVAKCIVEYCDHLYLARGYCTMHYLRLWRHGTLDRLTGGKTGGRGRSTRRYPSNKETTLLAMNRRRFGGLRETVIHRDNEKCVMCGITREQHKLIYNKDITVNHINKRGRYSDNPDNRLENLETLCFRCHGHKDAIKHGKYAKYIA